MLTLTAILVSSLLAEPALLHRPTAAQSKEVSDRFTTLWYFSNREQVKIGLAHDRVKNAKLPSELPDGRELLAMREQAERGRLEKFLQHQLAANAALIERLRVSHLPPMPPIISTTPGAGPVPVGTIGGFNKPVRIIEVLDSDSVVIAVGEVQSLARIHLPTEGLAVNSELTFGETDLFVVVGTYQFESRSEPRPIPDIKQLDTSPIRAVIKRRVFPEGSPSEFPSPAPRSTTSAPPSPDKQPSGVR